VGCQCERKSKWKDPDVFNSFWHLEFVCADTTKPFLFCTFFFLPYILSEMHKTFYQGN
jgi:hypothetical protein